MYTRPQRITRNQTALLLDPTVSEGTIAERVDWELKQCPAHAAEGIHWVGPDGTILWANQTELDLLGYTREEYIGHNIAEFHVEQCLIDDILTPLPAARRSATATRASAARTVRYAMC